MVYERFVRMFSTGEGEMARGEVVGELDGG